MPSQFTITLSPELAQAVHDASEWMGSLIEPAIYGATVAPDGSTHIGFACHLPDDDWYVQWIIVGKDGLPELVG